ncbi:hypothetical protein [Gluconacetobacter tumulisoli]|uniref:Lipoprotein n=1 Tax=Gluconacetobacter tumulisoli TaxID=1286189 RepID=A0A7W4PJP3_9PROT|nr:hypothetical protein [Gluconacetobacter tumulisoli]MBB2200110.1 hypothetical protein [Gluconacetobacter tumulisoli]
MKRFLQPAGVKSLCVFIAVLTLAGCGYDHGHRRGYYDHGRDHPGGYNTGGYNNGHGGGSGHW